MHTPLATKIHDAIICNAMKNGYTLKQARILADAVVEELDHDTVLGLISGHITTLALMDKVKSRLNN